MVSLFLLLGCNLSYIVDFFADLHELASASARTLLKLASLVRALLKPYGHTFKLQPNDRNMPAQHVATLLGAACCMRLATTLRCVATCWVLLAQVWNWSNLSQQHPTCRNTVAKRTQHVAPNNVAICCVDMLRSLGRGLRRLERVFSFTHACNLHTP